jgi:hypothetical protein
MKINVYKFILMGGRRERKNWLHFSLEMEEFFKEFSSDFTLGRQKMGTSIRKKYKWRTWTKEFQDTYLYMLHYRLLYEWV